MPCWSTLANDPEITQDDLQRLAAMLKLMQPGWQAAMRDEENMKERWMRIDQFAVTKGDPVKANATCDIEASQ
eukprot:4763706-Karenia_brevis.AAC.1